MEGYTLDGAKKALKQRETGEIPVNLSNDQIIHRLEEIKAKLLSLKKDSEE